ncbi:MAG: hypothetical protein HWE20_13115 [Gammaproteobacteria bacterium]|nr:hypothetical protein [Gammaproteobacteria bacterium]
MKLKATLAALALPLIGATAQAEDNVKFDVGSVLMMCGSGDADVPDEDFRVIFPKFVAKLDAFAQEGKIARAHYMTELKGGIFIVVGGKDLNESRMFAGEINSELNKIVAETAEVKDLKGGCRIREIGPLAIAPR